LYRWGDALVRTVAVHLLVPPSQVHFFDDIGYSHQGICRNPCGRKIPGGCEYQMDPFSGFCGVHAKICTVENHVMLVMYIIFSVVGGFSAWVFGFSRHRHINRQTFNMYLQIVKMKLNRFDPRAKDT